MKNSIPAQGNARKSLGFFWRNQRCLTAPPNRMLFVYSFFLSIDMARQAMPMPSIQTAEPVSIWLSNERTTDAMPIARATALRIISTVSPIFSLKEDSFEFVLTCISSSTETPKISASFGTEFMSGKERSRSHFETALSVTPIFSANSSWVMPLCLRSSATIFPNACFSLCMPP